MADMTFNFNLKPNTTTLDLGDSTNKWQNLYVGTIAATTLQAPTTSGGSTLGVGSSGQFLSSNGTSSYWASLPTASTTAAGIIQIGTGATNACAGNDSRLSNSRTPTAHATTSTTYGGGTASNYGHVILTDTYATVSTSQKAANSYAASAWALQKAYDTLNSNITAFENFSTTVASWFNSTANATVYGAGRWTGLRYIRLAFSCAGADAAGVAQIPYAYRPKVSHVQAHGCNPAGGHPVDKFLWIYANGSMNIYGSWTGQAMFSIGWFY